MQLPFLPTNPTAVLADLAYIAILVGVPVALRYWRAHLKAIAKWYMSQTTAQERAVLSSLAHDAVAWAERYASSPAGIEKMKQAVALVQSGLKARGIAIDVTEVVAAIQAAVAAAKTSGALAAAGPTIVGTQPTAK